ncbi:MULTISPECIES: polysaccharide biosynthesis protein [Pelosinus]|nr:MULTISPECIES: nucleoside-diphosphate sugar epimerase/dehydratase [Pelosinus]
MDLCIVTISPYLSLYLRLDGAFNSPFYFNLFNIIPAIVVIRLVSFYFFGLYKRLWRYASINEVLVIVSAVTVSSIFVAGYIYAVSASLPKSIHFLDWFCTISFIGVSRFCVRLVHYWRKHKNKNCCVNVLIVGAGDAGAMIARELQQRYYASKNLVGFVDDDQYKHRQKLFGVKVLGVCKDISSIVDRYQVDEIIIAMPSLEGGVLRKIINECKATKCSVKTLPGIYELIDGKVSIQQLRNIDLEDLLRRDPVTLDMEEISSYLAGKRVLVTGAGGSIGSELCRQIAKMSPQMLIFLGKGENSIYEIDRELQGKYPNIAFEAVIADVRDEQRIYSVFKQFKPQVIFHAAAHKHVPLMEAQPAEAVRNNAFGTKIVAEAADGIGSEIFVMISTDKAVNPTSVMGATKRVAELIIQNMSKSSNTKFVAVRFGNVLGSRGSVIPLFKKQIAQGGPITITHPDMKRYFMTIPEASQLVLQAGALAKGGEVFVLDMGEPVKIVDMASDLIQLSGLVPYKDIKIQFSGLRPGEKLFEELLTAEEGTTSTKHKKIFVANLKQVDEQKLYHGLLMLKNEARADHVIKILMNLIPTYKSARVQYCMSLEKKETQIQEEYNERNGQWQPADIIVN